MDYAELDRLISALESLVNEAHPQKGYWSQVWAAVREVGAGFRGTRYPDRADHDAAWNRFQDLVAQAKRRGEQAKAQLEKNQRDWDDRVRRSEQARDDIESSVRAAGVSTGVADAIADVILLPVKAVVAVLFSLIGLSIDELADRRQELLHCNERLREAWAAFDRHKRALLPGDKAKCFESLQDAKAKLDEAWRRWKEANTELRQRRRREWEERERERERRRAEREQKHRLFVARVEANIEKLEGKLESARGALHRRKSHLAELIEKYSTARSDGFRERCSGWIDEERERISSIGEHIERLLGWITEERAKLR